jgi:hypothetical protein
MARKAYFARRLTHVVVVDEELSTRTTLGTARLNAPVDEDLRTSSPVLLPFTSARGLDEQIREGTLAAKSGGVSRPRASSRLRPPLPTAPLFLIYLRKVARRYKPPGGAVGFTSFYKLCCRLPLTDALPDRKEDFESRGN